MRPGIGGFPYVAHRAELQLVAVPLWHHKPLYQSYLVDRDHKGTGILDLRGDIHAFSDPDSNSGFSSRGRLSPSVISGRKRSLRRRYGHRDVIRAVASGLAGSGSVDGYVYEVVAELEPKLTEGTRILKASGWAFLQSPRKTRRYPRNCN